jgi:hypothetical protein
MSKVPYTFTVIRYVHDRAAGEALNVGVVVYAPSAQFIGMRVEPRFERLSKAFGGFDGDAYRRTLRRLGESVERLQGQWRQLPEIRELPKDAAGVIRVIWPDTDLSFEPGPVLAGVAVEPLTHVLAELFARMVSSQAPGRGETEKRTDEEVWTVYQQPLRAHKISHVLAPKVFTAPEFEIKFDHAFQNKQWHVVQPVTMDFVKMESLQDKATRWLGNATALQGHPQLGQLYLLLGQPQLESHHDAYVKAKNLLHKMPVAHVLVEENEASSFAEDLAMFMKQHGIVAQSDDQGQE